MQIHFLWVHNFDFLKNASINLSARFIFQRQESESVDTPAILVIDHNLDYIDGFFGKSNITNVSCIIGKNGSGKSSILKYIKSHMPEGLEARVQHDLIAYSIGSGEYEQYFVIQSEEFPIVLQDNTKLFQLQSYNGPDNIGHFRFESKLSDADYIYYSYFLEYNARVDNWHGLRNISTTTLIAEERRRVVEENHNSETASQMLMNASDLDNFVLSEVAKAIQFLNSEEATRLPFNKPEQLNIAISFIDKLWFTESNTPDIFKLLKELDGKPKAEQLEDRVLDNLLYAIFINYLTDERKYSSSNPYHHKIDLKPEESLREYLFRFFKTMQSASIEYNGQRVRIDKLNKLYGLVPQFFFLVQSLLERKILEPDRGSSTNLVLHLNDETNDAFGELRHLYLSLKGISTFFNFNWRELSTGEQSYLSFMVRFYHLRHHEHGTLKKNLVILIDEGDAGFHPEWQRQFFDRTLNFLSDLFSQHTIQLIFTANTPFLSSDLLKSHVLFLERKDNNTTIIHGKDNTRADTFGSNIHILFSDSFYMDGMLIGEFARQKINSVIEYLNDDKLSQRDNSIKKIIEQIGEPILKRKLLEMWSNKFGPEEELAALQVRMKELEKAINIKKSKK